jgi:hypothetical protein
VGHGGLTPGLTEAREAVERRRDGGEGGGGGALDAVSLRARREGKEGRGRSGAGGGVSLPFYRVRGGAGRPDGEGNQAASGGAPLWPSGLVGRENGRGEWGVKRGESAASFLREEGTPGWWRLLEAVAFDFVLGKKEAGRGPCGSERRGRRRAGPARGQGPVGREVGGWA